MQIESGLRCGAAEIRLTDQTSVLLTNSLRMGIRVVLIGMVLACFLN